MFLTSYTPGSSVIGDLDPLRDLTALLPEHEVEHVLLRKGEGSRALRRHPADVYINLCDGAWDDETPGIDVVEALERGGRAFTGAGSAFYDPTRLAMKMACSGAGVDSPPYVIARTAAMVEEAIRALRLPCFVKPEQGYSSVGIDAGARVETRDALRARASKTIEEFGGALIEEYIDGREYSVLVASNPADESAPLTYLPVEVLLPEATPFKTFDYKWRDTQNHWVPCADQRLGARLIEMTRDVFVSLRGTGYARSDIRVDREGRPWFLEINPNCSAFYPEDNGATADLILLYDGTRQAAFLRTLIDYALHRRRRSTPAYTIRHDASRGHGLFAARRIAQGEVIYSLEEEPHVLVTRAHVERTWGARARAMFQRCAYPLTDETWVIPSKDPEEWRPLNHSCDPNSWMDGLAVTARRPIRAGEEITFDHATMYTAKEAQLRCSCGAALCRGTWEGDDHLKPWFLERYGDHITEYVRASQQRAGLRGGGAPLREHRT
ncbi:SET domain-containing protein-lysine N-methyltransferase [Sorangium sp. So ce1128]